ncbi:MAG: serine protease Do [Acidobacteriota bacterium]|nr:serine protease Do [Acidobacteriota bacterium]
MRAENIDTVNCPSCGATLVAGLRFCRMCGYRLGEGVEEYVPTQRFDASSIPTAATSPPPATDPFAARSTWGAAPMQPIRPFGATSALNRPDEESAGRSWMKMCSRKRGGWWLWLTIALVLMIAGGMIPLSIRTRNRSRAVAEAGAPTNPLLAEADAYDTPDGGGAFIRGLAGPATSLEAAGLVGGDTITFFDGKPVRDSDTFRRLAAATPPGKVVEVVYIHDGETKKTMLTTTGRQDFRGMQPIDTRPGGRGIIGVDPGDRVRLPNSNIFGVELDGVERNGPADIAGLKKGDVIFEFGGKPIRTAGDLRLRIYEAVPGTTITVSVMREGQRVDVPMKIGRQRD